MKVDLKKFQDNLTTNQLFKIMRKLGINDWDDTKEDYIIFPTYCHNELNSEASMKLYYYKENKRFHCYTHCGDTFNIFEFVKRVFMVNNYREGNFTFRDIVNFCLEACDINEQDLTIKTNKYTSKLDRYKKKSHIIEVPTYENGLLDVFTKFYPQEWIDEGIGKAAMDKFNIRYSISQNKIIIPHYNIEGDLIGIRGRTLDEEEIKLYGKYMPVKIQDKLYNHPLSQALYGLNYTKDNIKQEKTAILFEAEKSVLLYETFFSKNISAAVCGSNFNKVQLELLLKNCHPKEIIICFDKEYERTDSKQAEEYFNKLLNLCKRYSFYCNLSFVFDRENLLGLKDSPIDRGRDVFLKLLEKRIKSWEL